MCFVLHQKGPVASVLEQSMLHEDDPLNMSIHSRRNVWEEKIQDGEQQKQEVARMHDDLRAAKTQKTTTAQVPATGARAKSPSRTTAASPGKSPTRVSSDVQLVTEACSIYGYGDLRVIRSVQQRRRCKADWRRSPPTGSRTRSQPRCGSNANKTCRCCRAGGTSRCPLLMTLRSRQLSHHLLTQHPALPNRFVYKSIQVRIEFQNHYLCRANLRCRLHHLLPVLA